MTFDKAKPAIEKLAGGGINEPFRGKATTTAKFSEPGEYVAARHRERLLGRRRRRRGVLLDDGDGEGDGHALTNRAATPS